MEERKMSFVLHLDMLEDIKEMTTEEKAAFLDFVCGYNLGTMSIDDIEAGATKRYFRLFANQFDRDHQKWMATKEKRKIAGQKGGLAKASKPSNCYDNLANASDAKHNVNVNVNSNVNANKDVDVDNTFPEGFRRIALLFTKKVSRTTFSHGEKTAWNKVSKTIKEHDYELLEWFYGLEKAKNFNSTWKRKGQPATLLNNLDEQLDLAYEMKEAERKQQPKLGTPTQW
jgi:hypothetical protein